MGWTDVVEVTRAGTAIVELQGVAPGTKASPYTGYLPKILVPRYSEDMNAAMLVVEKMSREFHFGLDNELGKPWLAEFTLKENDGYPVIEGQGSTAAHAICLASLKANESRGT
jgi:hypothetical protein